VPAAPAIMPAITVAVHSKKKRRERMSGRIDKMMLMIMMICLISFYIYLLSIEIDGPISDRADDP
jgi:hypothetical protein